MTPSTKRWLIAGAATIFVAAVYVARVRDGMADFAVNYQAGQRLAAGETLYQTVDGHYMFKYLPFSALLYLPLAALPFEAAKAIWFGLSVAAMLVMFRLGRQLVSREAASYLAIVSGLVLAKYFLHELRLGQINALITLIMMLAIRALTRPGDRQDAIAGALAGLATALKPYAALLLAYLVITRRWTSVAAGLAVLGVSLAVPAVFYGIDGNLRVLGEWASTLSASTPDLLTNTDNVSVVAFFTKWTGDPTRALPLAGLLLGVLGLLTLVVIRRGGQQQHAPVLDGAMVLTLIPLVSPLGWDYTFLMALLATMLLVHHFDSFPVAARVLLAANFAIIALAVYDIMGRQAYATFMQWSVTTLNFLIIVGGLTYLRVRRVC